MTPPAESGLGSGSSGPAAVKPFVAAESDRASGSSPVGSNADSGDRTLRVAIDATPLLGQRTGVGIMTAALTERLAVRDDVELDGFVVSWRARDEYHTVLPAGCRPVRMPVPARISHHLWRHLDRPRLRTGADVVHGTNYVVPPTDGAAELVTVHDLTAWHFPELVDRYSRAFPRLVARAVDRGAHIHCVSRFVAGELVDTMGVPADRVHVVTNGFNPVEGGDAERGRALIGSPYVLSVGTIEPRKDYVTLIRAMVRVWGHHPDMKLVIVGKDGWGIDAVERALADVGAGDRVIRRGYAAAQEKADLLAGCRLLAFPSRYEGFGLPILEAFGASVPVVATQAGAIGEVAGDAALLVPPQNVDDLAAAIIQANDNEGLRASLIERGHRRVQTFSWDASAEALVDLYRRLAG